MAYLRLSRARYQYTCDRCSRNISKGRDYYRLEPFPIARIKGIETVKYLCLTCIQGEQPEEVKKETQDWLRNYWIRGTEVQLEQLPLLRDEPIMLVRTQVHVINITSELLNILLTNPNEIYNLTPEIFEELICDRLQVMGFGVERVGGHSFRKDGGIDVVAWPKIAEFPFLMAIQAKHHRSAERKTGPGPIRELIGVMQSHPFNAGVLVTNTTFTPDARWIVEQKPLLVRLRDIQDIRRWLENDFLDEHNWREIPNKITVCPGVVVHLPGSSRPTIRQVE